MTEAKQFAPPPLPAGWREVAGPGYRIRADHHTESPLAFAEAVAAGLDSEPRTLPYRYLYDRAGSEIYERITAQPEYYPTRTEESILARHAADIRQRAGDVTVVEFGSGSSAKTRRLLEAWTAEGATRYVPIDISRSALEAACVELAGEFPGLDVEGIASTYERAMPLVRDLSPVLFVFLGSSIGNFAGDELDRFLEMVGRNMAPGDHFLLGIDLVKSPRVLEAAYNDEAGWTERFTLNLFERLNRELDAGVPLEQVEHVAYYNERLDRIEIYARFRSEITFRIDAIDRKFRLAAGEMVRTEISRKFRPHDMAANAARFGLVQEALYTDPLDHFGVLLLRRGASAPVQESRAHRLEVLLGSVRARTQEIVAPLDEQELIAQPDELMGPLIWDLGHIADFEALWLLERLRGERGSGSAEGLDPTYDPNVHPRAGRGALDLPGPDAVRRRLAEVRARCLAWLREHGPDPTDPLTADGLVYRMVAQHESQHQETMLQALQLREDLEYRPALDARQPSRPQVGPVAAMLLVPAGPCTIGTDDRTIAYDNERPLHEVELEAFRIDAAPVTNGAFLGFVEDDGYRRRDLWCDEGWRWKEREAARAPLYWQRREGQWMRRRFGEWVPLDAARPVMHVCWFEADAFARWAGKRVPTEQEWEKAASWDPARGHARARPWGDREPRGDLANLGQRMFEPTAVGTYPQGRSFYGCHQMLGDVYEWTASEFLPYPGFEAFPYPEYSEVFFGRGYKVLRGASWAVPEFMARNTYRNWDLPERRQLFAGFRCARDA